VRRPLVVAAVVLAGLAAAWRWAVTEPVAPFLLAQAQVACRDGDLGRLALLDALGVPVAGRWNGPLLGVAAASGRLEVMEYLVSHGVSVNQPGTQTSPLERAAGAGQLEAARWLLRHGASPSLPGERLPLAAALRACQPELVVLLLEHGARAIADPSADLAVAAAGGCSQLEELMRALPAQP